MSSTMQSFDRLLEVQHLTKAFSGVPVLENVHFEVRAGEVHALVGENGAGKSTLMNIITGAHQPDAGRILWKDCVVQVKNPRAAHALGINMVHQELMLVPQLSVGENIFLARYPTRRLGFRWIRWPELHARAGALLRDLGHRLDPKRLCGELSIAEQQLVEIARGLAFKAELIIMDEPTSPLSEHETSRLFQTIVQLKARGVSVIYISHRLKEIFEIADRVTVLRDGRHIVTQAIAETDLDELVQHMVGRAIAKQYPAKTPPAPGGESLRVEGLTARGRFYDVNLRLRRGEVVGLAGLVGAGRTELVESLFGAGKYESGHVFLDGRPAAIRSPEDAVRHGLALVADDRKTKGLVLAASVKFNVALASGRSGGHRALFLDAHQERETAARWSRSLRLKAPDLDYPVMHLSGGNQQKVVLAKWLAAQSKIFFFDEPTRGIDVGSKADIYELIRQLAQGGAAILLISSELEELLHLADRILVMHRGRIAGELMREEATEERIMKLATGART